MKFALIALFICLFACNNEDVTKNEYQEATDLYYTNIKECERLALQSHNKAFEAGDKEQLAKFSYLLGVINSRNEKYKIATDFFNNAISDFKDIGDEKYIAQCLNSLGYVYNKSENFDFANTCLKRALEIKTNDDEVLYKTNYNLAESYFGLGQKDKALRIIKTVLLTESNDKKLMGYRFIRAGYISIKGGYYDDAIIYLNKSISLDKDIDNISNCYSNLAYAYLMKDDLPNALSFANKGLKLNRDFSIGDILRTRALIYIKKQEYDLASADLNKSLKYKPNHSETAKAYKLIALAHEATGNKDLSSKYFKLNGQALEEKASLGEEESKEAKTVRDSIFLSRENEIIKLNRQKDFYKYLFIAISLAVATYFGVMDVRKRLKLYFIEKKYEGQTSTKES